MRQQAEQALVDTELDRVRDEELLAEEVDQTDEAHTQHTKALVAAIEMAEVGRLEAEKALDALRQQQQAEMDELRQKLLEAEERAAVAAQDSALQASKAADAVKECMARAAEAARAAALYAEQQLADEQTRTTGAEAQLQAMVDDQALNTAAAIDPQVVVDEKAMVWSQAGQAAAERVALERAQVELASEQHLEAQQRMFDERMSAAQAAMQSAFDEELASKVTEETSRMTTVMQIQLGEQQADWEQERSTAQEEAAMESAESMQCLVACVQTRATGLVELVKHQLAAMQRFRGTK